MPGVGTQDGLTEAARVYLNRLQEALDYKFPREAAHRFADSDIDIGVLRKLRRDGCPPATAARILKT